MAQVVPMKYPDVERWAWSGPKEAQMIKDFFRRLKEDEDRRRGQEGNGKSHPIEGERVPEGRRDVTLTSMAGAMRKRGFGFEAMLAALREENRLRCDPPLEEADLERIARSMARYAPDDLAGIRLACANGHSGNGTGSKTEQDQEEPFPPIVPLSALKLADPSTKWIVKGLFGRDAITLFSALWKAGKTTLLAHLLKALETPGWFCGLEVAASRVMYVTEEHESLWAERREELHVGDHVHFLVRPFRGKPSLARWLDFMAYLGEHLSRNPFDLVVLDTISKLWPVRDENDAAHVGEALMPLWELARGRSLCLVHHLRKGDGREATASRGSGELGGFADIILEMRRFCPGNRKDRKRVLTGYGRWREIPDEMVVELGQDGFQTCGDREQAGRKDLVTQIKEMLPGLPPGLTGEEILDSWPGDSKPRRNSLFEALNHGHDVGLWARDGEGRKGSPHTYYLPEG